MSDIANPHEKARELIRKMEAAHLHGDEDAFDEALGDLRELHKSLEDLENDGK